MITNDGFFIMMNELWFIFNYGECLLWPVDGGGFGEGRGAIFIDDELGNRMRAAWIKMGNW